MQVEIYDGYVPGIVGALPPPKGYVTFLSVDERDRVKCMKRAACEGMGSADAVRRLAQLPGVLLLQCLRVDGSVTTTEGFEHVAQRALAGSKNNTGAKVADWWLGTYSAVATGAFDDRGPRETRRCAYGFILMEKPEVTLAEYTIMAGDLEKSVKKAAPLLADLSKRLHEAGACWPRSASEPSGVGLYVRNAAAFKRENGAVRVRPEPERAVVLDWSECVKGDDSAHEIRDRMLENYKSFLADLEVNPMRAVYGASGGMGVIGAMFGLPVLSLMIK